MHAHNVAIERYPPYIDPMYSKFIFFVSHSYSIRRIIWNNKTSNVLIVTAKSNSVDCHMCPGFIIIEKGIQKDTLKMGSWGSPPNFNQFKANGGDYIAFESSYFSAGINESSLSILSLNEDSYLTPVFDTLISDEQINSLKITNNGISSIPNGQGRL